jgi:hypothetical protein
MSSLLDGAFELVEILDSPAYFFDFPLDSLRPTEPRNGGSLSLKVLLQSIQLAVQPHQIHSPVLAVQVAPVLRLPLINATQYTHIASASAALEFRRLKRAHFLDFLLVHVVKQKAFRYGEQFFFTEIALVEGGVRGR